MFAVLSQQALLIISIVGDDPFIFGRVFNYDTETKILIKRTYTIKRFCYPVLYYRFF